MLRFSNGTVSWCARCSERRPAASLTACTVMPTRFRCKYSEIVWLRLARTASTRHDAMVITGLPNTYVQIGHYGLVIHWHPPERRKSRCQVTAMTTMLTIRPRPDIGWKPRTTVSRHRPPGRCGIRSAMAAVLTIVRTTSISHPPRAVGAVVRKHQTGACAAMPRADDHSQCEIGFTIAPRYQGRGYVTDAVRLLVDYLF